MEEPRKPQELTGHGLKQPGVGVGDNSRYSKSHCLTKIPQPHIKVSLCRLSVCLGMFSEDQAGLCLSSAGVKDMRHNCSVAVLYFPLPLWAVFHLM